MNTVTESTFTLYDDCSCSENLRWTEEGRETVCTTSIFTVESVKRGSTDGRHGDFTVVNSRKWVNVIPFFKGTDGQDYFVMERQFRHGSNSVTVEFPGGIIEDGEKPEDAALRELAEETGIKAERLTFLGDINPNAAFISGRGYIFLAEQLNYTSERHLDCNEQIEVITIPVKELISKLGKGEFDNGSLFISSCFFLKRFQ